MTPTTRERGINTPNNATKSLLGIAVNEQPKKKILPKPTNKKTIEEIIEFKFSFIL